jgi:3-phenylpropionate/trans-cinnamate dioxygenase ferredoxin subunit
VSAHRVGPLEGFADGKAHRVELDGVVLALIRIGDDVYVIGDRCSHQDVSLSEGEVDVEERTLECWKHGSAFSLETGDPTSLPATRPVPVFDARVVDGEVEVVVE